MEFKELYQKYLSGECTEAERKFVEDEIERARIVSDEIFKEHKGVELSRVTDEEVLKAKKRFNEKNLVKTIVISAASFIVLAGIGAAAVYAAALAGARRNINYTDAQAEEIIREQVSAFIGNSKRISGSAEIDYMRRDEKDLQFRSPLASSYYIYEYEVYAGGLEFEVEFNPKTGTAVITDVDD